MEEEPKRNTPEGITIKCMKCGSHIRPDGKCPKCKTENVKLEGGAKITFSGEETKFEV